MRLLVRVGKPGPPGAGRPQVPVGAAVAAAAETQTAGFKGSRDAAVCRDPGKLCKAGQK